MEVCLKGTFYCFMNKKENKENQKNGAYRASDITVLEGLDPVRKRPGMYIGTTGPDGIHHLIVEIFDNGRDEAMGGFADHIEIVLLPGNRVRIVDNGRGIPVDIHKQTKVSALETIMTTLHAGGKFGGEGYKISGGLHGVGASVVNALSVYTKAEVYRDGGKYVQEYSKGKKKSAVKKVGPSKLTGTIITFEPDKEIFPDITYNWEKLVRDMRQQAYLVKGLRITLIDAKEYSGKISEDSFFFKDLKLDVPSESFYFEGGLVSLIKSYNSNQKEIHKNIFYVEKESDGVFVEIALQYIDDISSRVVPFANNIYNSEGGTHITGFKTALTRTLNNYSSLNGNKSKDKAKNGKGKEKDNNFTGEDVLEGLTAVISVKLKEIQFEGQTKGKLGSPEARGAVETVFGEALSAFLEEKPDDAKAIIGKATLALKARKAAKAAKDSILRKGALEGSNLPGKLADCQSKNPVDSELFIVEGDSAGGTTKTGRDRKTQAVLPIRGKILNVERARLDKMLASEQIKNIVIALGTAIGDTFDIESLRYHKIIIAADADVDGAHIRTLILTLFYRYLRPVIEGGFLYIAQPPLYKIEKGKKILAHVFSDEEKDKVIAHDGEPDKISIQRYKGLGEMNADELWETTMNPENRVLKQVKIIDAQEADKVFDILMGTDVSSRKSFIQSNAKMANLDI
jgi:DNA gyrase subunit B